MKETMFNSQKKSQKQTLSPLVKDGSLNCVDIRFYKGSGKSDPAAAKKAFEWCKKNFIWFSEETPFVLESNRISWEQYYTSILYKKRRAEIFLQYNFDSISMGSFVFYGDKNNECQHEDRMEINLFNYDHFDKKLRLFEGMFEEMGYYNADDPGDTDLSHWEFLGFATEKGVFESVEN